MSSLHFSNLIVTCSVVQSSVFLLILRSTACTMEVQGEDQVVTVEAQNVTPVQMGNIKQSDLLAGLVQGKPRLWFS